ncbi:helix-turn-helix domain-containing protein [Desulforamulus aquiferis]|uniref:DUF4115 domain-containing protein n=1 Tax=Desulforamulus aquiferis TaxID=1397668 RepID=A0AAW7ZDZ9_9FIRM|nr:helix-turn-helix domain-containing protein [Desulforamulus aquiferis]MDO7787464.1 DUF4115 domain-containing protein [Desulforamulus aquiferis]RYD05425.1 hypothetical protein N752_08760 [Desulforamulus aquiferis]
MPIGEALRSARIAKGYSFEHLEEATKIRAKYLEALENEKYDVLPGPIYAKAFLRTYAKYLGLNIDEIMSEYNSGQEDTPVVVENRVSEEATNLTASKRWRYIVAGFAVVALIGINAIYNAGARPEQNKPDVPRVVEGQPGDANNAGTPSSNGQSQGPVQPNDGVRVVLRVTENESWMQVVADGNTVFSGLVAPGEMKDFQAREKIFLHVGNAGAVEANVNGQDLGKLGEKGKVVKKDFFAGQTPEVDRG